jgi:hypothetical protein
VLSERVSRPESRSDLPPVVAPALQAPLPLGRARLSCTAGNRTHESVRLRPRGLQLRDQADAPLSHS